MSIVTVTNLSNPVAAFTPSLTFGGAAVGMAYASRVGTYVKVGSLVCFNINISLSAKGSSVGNAVISGLPFTVQGSAYGAVSIGYVETLSSITGQLLSLAPPGGTSLTLYQIASGSGTPLTNANFGNASIVYLSGAYLV
jgi:hypothetical protein